MHARGPLKHRRMLLLLLLLLLQVLLLERKERGALHSLALNCLLLPLGLGGPMRKGGPLHGAHQTVKGLKALYAETSTPVQLLDNNQNTPGIGGEGEEKYS